MRNVWNSIAAAVTGVAMAAAMLAATAGAQAIEVEARDTAQYEITVKNTDEGYGYAAYQVFSGTLGADGALGDVEWGEGVDGGAVLDALRADADKAFDGAFDNAQNASAVAKTLGGQADSSDFAKAFAQVAGAHLSGKASATADGVTEGRGYVLSVAKAGYYLVRNTKTPDQYRPGQYANTEYILKVVKDETVTPKGEVPSVTKKVQDADDSDTDGASDWQDSADYDIGDLVPYRLEGTLPGNIASYRTYHYRFTDTMSKGLTYAQDAKAYVVNGGVETELDASSYTIVTDSVQDGDYAGGTKLTVTFDDLKAAKNLAGDPVTIDASSLIRIEYHATLNEQAVIGSAGNPNKVDLTFSDNPNQGGEGETGTTPEDKVIVFTFRLSVHKKDQQGGDLDGAAFTLSKWNAAKNAYETVSVIESTKDRPTHEFAFAGLDAGRYKLEETRTPDGYNTWKGVEFRIEADHETDSADPQLNNLVFKDLDGNAITDFVVNAGVADYTVVNVKGAILPSTGGAGTVGLYAAGIACVIAAGGWFAMRRRR